MQEPRDLVYELLLQLRGDFSSFRDEMTAFRHEMTAFRGEMATFRAGTTVQLGHLNEAVADLRQDVRRIDGRVDQLFLVQTATLASIVAALVTVLVTLLAS
jgi:hypothetical protein